MIKQTVNLLVDVSTSSFDVDITDVNFEPDEMIVKAISYTNTALASEFAILTSNLVDWKTIFCFSCPASSCINAYIDAYFPINKKVNGRYTFISKTVAGGVNDLNGLLSIQLLFIKHSK